MKVDIKKELDSLVGKQQSSLVIRRKLSKGKPIEVSINNKLYNIVLNNGYATLVNSDNEIISGQEFIYWDSVDEKIRGLLSEGNEFDCIMENKTISESYYSRF